MENQSDSTIQREHKKQEIKKIINNALAELDKAILKLKELEGSN